MPEARQALRYQDLTQTPPTAIEASFHGKLAPGTMATRPRVMQGCFGFRRAQGTMAQSPMRHPRQHLLVPQDLPRPMGEDEVVALFRVIDALRDRTIFLFMLRGGLRVGEVTGLSWAAIACPQGTLRLDPRKGHVDRVVSLASDVAQALRQWQRLQTAAAPYVFPRRMTRKGGLPRSARQIRNGMTRSLKLAGLTQA